MLPLVSGYLQAYAQQDPVLRDSLEFRKFTACTQDDTEQIIAELLQHDSRVYALSCYLWNMRMMRQIASTLLEQRPDAYVLLGGPQVMRHAHEYLDPSSEKCLICNGEGEITFSNFLREVREPAPNFENVKGLSFYRDGKLITTEAQPRVQSLDDVPSPYLNGIFDGNYRMAVMETNRGCPFRCTYCYWGAATNDKVHKFGEERLREEITWLGKNSVPMIYLADANWGMLTRDIDLSSHIADCKREYGVPHYVYFSAAKNSPERVSKIARVFDNAGMLNIQPVSLQTMDQNTLATVDRSNIKTEAYHLLQTELNENGIGSFIELIWPLPGETLSSFKQGIEDLCTMDAAHLIAYTNLLLHNTPMYHQKEELGIVTRSVADKAAEAELVVATNELTYDEFKDGMRYFYGVLALYNTRATKRLAAWLHENELMSHAEFFDGFVEYCQAHPNTFTAFCEESIANDNYYEIANYPTVYHITLHQNRAEFDQLLFDFAVQQDWWADETARFLFEFDLLTKPYLYSNTPVADYERHLRLTRVVDRADRSITVSVPPRLVHLINPTDDNRSPTFRLNHSRGQFPFNESRNREENASYCSGRIQLIHQILPDWEPVVAT